jgi:protein arginine N-methyltransferase 1
MTETTAYRLASYGEMVVDRGRMEPYARALREAVRPGIVVLDVGAGTGIFSLLACQAGAGRVHAVEPDDAIEVARAAATANGFADRIVFHQALSSEVTLAERADVVVSDLRGVLPLFQGHVPAIVDVRERLLAAGGVLIPRRDTLWAAPLEDAKLRARCDEPWVRNEHGLDLRAGLDLVVNAWRRVSAKAEHLLAPPVRWATLDYATIERPGVAGEMEWTVERAGEAHGVLVWFDAELADGVGFSNAPGRPELIYGQAFFPLREAVTLAPGDRVQVELRADLTGDDYTWQWRTRVLGGGKPATLNADFRQSTFFGSALSPGTLRKREAGFRPALGEAGNVDRFILSQMDGQTTLEEIARRATETFPGRFRTPGEALGRVGDLSARHAR